MPESSANLPPITFRRERPVWVLPTILALTAVTFILDLLTSLGWAVWVLYLLPLLLTAQWAPRKYLVPTAAVCIALMGAGLLFSTPAIPVTQAAFNRFMGVLVLWTATFLLAQSKQADETLPKLYDALEQQVEERTAEFRMAIEKLKQEIADRKRAEEALRSSEQRLRLIMEHANDAIFFLDPNGVVQWASPGATVLSGRALNELLGRPVTTILAPGSAAIAEARLAAARRGESVPPLVETEILRPDGGSVWLELNATNVEDAQGPAGRLIVARDITERKRAEKALRESEAFKSQILQSDPDCIKVLDLEGRLLFMNESGQQLMEIGDIAKFLNSSWIEFWKGDDKKRVSAAVEAARAGGTGRFVGFNQTATGKPKWWEVFVTPLLDAEGKPYRLLAISRDITEQKQAEADRRDLYERLQESHKGLRTLSQRLLEAQELERRRIARELHDETGQTLTSLLIGMRTLEEMPMREAVRKRVSELRKTVARAINEIKRLALGLHPSVLDDLGLEPALRRLAEEFVHAHGLMVDLHMSGLDGHRLPLAVETILYRIAQEALTNVAKHAGGARVSILLQCSPSAAKVIIEDDGRGFDVQTVLKSAGRSNHMGLHGMRERAALLNGSIEIESTPGGGTTIYVQVPIGRGWA